MRSNLPGRTRPGRMRHSTETEELAASFGVTPVTTEMFGVTAPFTSSVPAPAASVPIPKCVIVFVPPVEVGKVMVAAGTTAFAVTVHPAPERAIATRA